MRLLITIVFLLSSQLIYSQTLIDTKTLWSNIPFSLKGANLCDFQDSASMSSHEYISQYIRILQQLPAGKISRETIEQLQLNYQRNINYAQNGLSLTLESIFKSYFSKMFLTFKPLHKKIKLLHSLTSENVANTDLFAYGTYSISSKCNGDIIVTLTIINRKHSTTTNYIASGEPNSVMEKIAFQVFENFQKTKFPSIISLPQKKIKIMGGLNGQVDTTRYLEKASDLCQVLNARLPNETEYKIIDSFGDWSGGVSLKRKIWAMSKNKIFVPYFPIVPVRSASQINTSIYHYVCIQEIM